MNPHRACPARASSPSATTSRPRWSPTTICARPDGHQRRVDPRPGSASPAAVRRAGRDAWSTWRVTAGGKALAASGLSAADIDLVIVATCTHAERRSRTRRRQVATGSASPRPARTTSTRPAPASSTALGAAASARPHRAGHATSCVVGAEKLTDWVDPTDRSTAIIFADGAGAAVVGPRPTSGGIGPVAWGSAGRRGPRPSTSGTHGPSSAGGPGGLPVGDHRDRARSRWRPASAAGSTPTDLAAFVPHQANLRIIDAIARKLGAARTPSSPATSSRPATPRPRPIPLALARHGRARRDAVRRARAAARLRRRPDLRRAGRRSAPDTDLPRPSTARPANPNQRKETTQWRHRAEIRAGLAEILEEVAGVLPADVSDEKSFTDDLDVDSLSMVEIAWPPRRSSASRSRTTSWPT